MRKSELELNNYVLRAEEEERINKKVSLKSKKKKHLRRKENEIFRRRNVDKRVGQTDRCTYNVQKHLMILSLNRRGGLFSIADLEFYIGRKHCLVICK